MGPYVRSPESMKITARVCSKTSRIEQKMSTLDLIRTTKKYEV